MDADRNLLFGAMTVRAGLVDAGGLTEACTAWAAGEAGTLADAMVDRGLITEEARDEVGRAVGREVEAHGGDPAAALAATLDGPLREALTQADAAAVRRTISIAPGRAGHVVLSALGPVPDGSRRYTRTRLHATGGIGRVWLARDASFGREVALKEIRPEREGNEAVWSRFLEEARITGQLEHPGIVPVYELGAGGDGSHPYYTMRFVRGRTLLEASHAYHVARVEGRATPLDLAALLNAFVGVCNAVAYAHSRGVIHRDLKGQNVVLGDFGEAILLDWGLAKIVDGPDAGGGGGDGGVGGDEGLETLPGCEAGRFETVAGRALGTPAYMPPEQAEGRLDRVGRRSDVYGLGAILYEILTGRAPFDGGTTAEILRKVVEQDPPRPRAVVPGTPPALEAICLKALAKEPSGRYASAKDLADDVRRWLADEPVSAYSDPWTTRLGRWAKRHRAPVAAAAALVATSAVALSISSVLIRRERDEARLQRNEARLQRGQARSAVDDMYTEVAEAWLEDRLDAVQKRFLEKALAYYEAFAGRDGDDPTARLERGRAYRRMGDILTKLGRREGADAAYRKAAEVFRSAAADAPDDPGPRHDLAGALAGLGVVLSDRGDFRGAEALFEEARAIRRPLIEAGRATPRDRVDMARADKGLAEVRRKRGELGVAEGLFRAACDALAPADFGGDAVAARKVLADARDRLGLIYKETGRYALAAEAFAAEAGALRAVVEAFPTLPGPRQALANALRSTGLMQQNLEGQADRAPESFRRAAELADRLAEEYPLRPEYRRDAAKCHVNLGQSFFFRGDLDAAEPHYRRAIALYERLVVDVPDVLQYCHDLARACNNLGLLLKQVGKPAEAERSGRRAVDAYSDLVARVPDVPEYRKALAESQMNLGLIAEVLAEIDRADDLFGRAQEGHERLAARSPDAPGHRAELAKVLLNRANLRIREADRLAILAARDAHEPPVLAGSADRLAWMVRQVDRRARAAALRREAGPMIRRVVALDEALVARSGGAPEPRANLANALNSLAQLRPPDAEAISRRALGIAEKLAADDPAVVSYARMVGILSVNLGEFAETAGRRSEADAWYGRAIATIGPLSEKEPDDVDLKGDLAEALADLGGLRLAAGAPSEARGLLERAAGLRRVVYQAHRKDPGRRLDLYAVLEALARAHLALGEHAEAARVAAEMGPLSDGPARGGLDALSVLARCAALAGSDSSLPVDRRREVARDYVGRAVGAIRGAIIAAPPVVGRFEASDLIPRRRGRA